MHEVLMETKNLDVYYGSQQAIKNVTLQFARNETVALIGPSGCGKSTYLRSLNLMNREIHQCKVQGEILYKNSNINEAHTDVYQVRREIAMVFQQPNPFKKSIYENVAFAPKRHGLRSKARLNELVENSLRKAALWDEVKDKLETSAYALSGGQQQRLCIARAIALQPEVILLDEPCSALDPISTRKIEELMDDLRKDYGIITVTHNMEQAKRVADKTAFFYMGKMIETTDTHTLFNNPKNQLLVDYLEGLFG